MDGLRRRLRLRTARQVGGRGRPCGRACSLHGPGAKLGANCCSVRLLRARYMLVAVVRECSRARVRACVR